MFDRLRGVFMRKKKKSIDNLPEEVEKKEEPEEQPEVIKKSSITSSEK